MLKNFKIAGILCAIALFCAVMIAGVNMLTEQIIADNNTQTELDTCKAIFSDYDQEKSEQLEVDNDSIVKKVLAKDSSGNELGYLYTVSGKNAYGVITLMVAVKNNKVVQVEFLENGQSFASTVVDHVKKSYPSSEDSTLYLWMAPEKLEPVSELTLEDVENINTSCGATYGADTIKELVKVALNDAKGGN